MSLLQCIYIRSRIPYCSKRTDVVYYEQGQLEFPVKELCIIFHLGIICVFFSEQEETIQTFVTEVAENTPINTVVVSLGVSFELLLGRTE